MRERGGPRRYVMARMDRHVLSRDAKIPHPWLQRRAFAHGPASGQFKAAFGDPQAGRLDPDRRLQLFHQEPTIIAGKVIDVSGIQRIA